MYNTVVGRTGPLPGECALYFDKYIVQATYEGHVCARATDCVSEWWSWHMEWKWEQVTVWVNDGRDTEWKWLQMNMCNLDISFLLDFGFHCANSHFFLSEVHKEKLGNCCEYFGTTTLNIGTLLYMFEYFITWLQNPSMPRLPRMNAILHPTYTVDNERCI